MKPNRPFLMVVDDEAEVLRSLYDLFRMDYRVLTYTSPSEALARLAEGDIPVVLSDQRMPEMPGVEFLQRAGACSPETTRLIFTGYADIKAVVDSINQGNVFRYIQKPWDTEELSGSIRQAMEHHDLVVSRRRLFDELQIRNAQLVEASRLKSAFIEVASHELNTPVAVILGLTELWRLQIADSADSTTRAWVDRMNAAGQRLAAIVQRMLKLLRADQFETVPELGMTSIEELIQEVVGTLEPFLEARCQRVRVSVEPGVGEAEIDREKIGDVLTNLVVNAIKFSPDGREIAVEATVPSPDWIRIAVTDQGVGIGPAERKHLFEPFFTCFDTLHHSSGQFQFGKRGIGLGLHLVKAFVELHGGRMEEVRSAPQDGSTFAFQIPRHPPLLKAAEVG